MKTIDEAIREDFMAWNGGYTPVEASDEIETYIEVACPTEYATKDVRLVFVMWCKELGDEELAAAVENG
jgi:hypothetical protein